MTNPQNAEGVGAAYELEVPNFYGQISCPSIGNIDVDVFANAKKTVFSYTPLLLVDWGKFEKELVKIDKNSSELQRFSISLQFSTQQFEADLRSQLKNRSESVLNLTALPYTYYRIEALFTKSKRTVVLNPTDVPESIDGISLSKKYSIPNSITYYFDATADELVRFYEERASDQQLTALLFSDGYTYSSSYINALAKILSTTEAKKEILGDESMEDKTIVRNSSSGAGVGLSFPGGSIGAGKSDGKRTTEKIRKRLLNRTYLSDFIRENKTKLSIEANADAKRVEYVLRNLTDRLFSIGISTTVQFQKLADDEYELLVAENNYTRIGIIKGKELSQAKPEIVKTDGQKAKVKYGGVEVDVEKNSSFTTKDDITWSYDGESLIPSKVEVGLFSDVHLSSEFDYSALLITREGVRSTVTKFLYPAAWLADAEHPNEKTAPAGVAPIGAIVSFSGPTISVPAGWQLCDGRSLNTKDFPELFGIIGFRWGKTSDSDFNLPDLRGVFVRGADPEGIKDPDGSTRENSAGERGEVGSFQMDAIQAHVHTGIFPNGGASFEHHQYNERTPAMVWTDRTGGVADAKTSSETRPKNCAVNYVIRTH